MNKGTVLLVDDDNEAMKFYEKALIAEGFQIERFFGPDEAFAYIEQEAPDFIAIILDIMMLPGRKYGDEDTDEGLRTGYFMYVDLCAIRKYSNAPIIVLTNNSNQETLSLFPETSLLRVVQKLDYPPFELVELVNSMIQANN